MTIKKARVSLLSVFLVCFVVQGTAFAFPFLKSRIYSDELLQLLLTLFKVYSVQLAVVLGVIVSGFFTQGRGLTKATQGSYFWIAFVLISIWNVLLMWRSACFGFFQMGTVSDISEYLEQVSTYSSWLVAGGLSFYFLRQ